jgi:YD repeat-containing protein
VTTNTCRGTTSYGYDVGRRLTQLTYPDGRADPWPIRSSSDAWRRLTQLTYPDGHSLTYGYDAHGDRTSPTAKIGSPRLTTTTGYDGQLGSDGGSP